MTIKELKDQIDKYSDDQEIRIFINCLNKSIGIDQILSYDTDVMIYPNREDEKELYNVRP